VFITGGARRIETEVARRLHAKEAKLVLTALDEQPLSDYLYAP
jgi:NAD(P)-dependent dehydrogenase (short-subunit alcohol dehydrogenase family)